MLPPDGGLPVSQMKRGQPYIALGALSDEKNRVQGERGLGRVQDRGRGPLWLKRWLGMLGVQGGMKRRVLETAFPNTPARDHDLQACAHDLPVVERYLWMMTLSSLHRQCVAA